MTPRPSFIDVSANRVTRPFSQDPPRAGAVLGAGEQQTWPRLCPLCPGSQFPPGPPTSHGPQIQVQLATAKRWKQRKCPSTDEQISKTWYMHTMEYYSASGRKKYSTHTEIWLHLEDFNAK